MRTLFLSLFLFLMACSDVEPEKIVLFSGSIFGTSYNVKVVVEDPEFRPEEIQRKIDTLLNDIDLEMSTYKNNSSLSQFNQAEINVWYPVPQRLVEVIKASQSISESSQGAFDVTVGPLVNLWGFGPKARPERIPTREELSSVLNEIGYQNLEYRTDSPALKKNKDIYVDLSAIAKGFAVDQVAYFLEAEGYFSYLVEIGGEMRGKGLKPNGKQWVVGIEVPNPEMQRQVQKVISLDDAAIATSGDYRNYYEEDGKRYSHTIDTRTGYPIEHGLASVTVVAETSMRADALATTLMVLGPEAGFQFANERDLAVYMIIRSGDEFSELSTTKFKQMVY